MPTPGGPLQNAIDFLSNFLSGFGSGLSATGTNATNTMSNAQTDSQNAADSGSQSLAENMVAEVIDATDIPITVNVYDNANNLLDTQTFIVDLNGKSFVMVNGSIVVNRVTSNAVVDMTLP